MFPSKRISTLQARVSELEGLLSTANQSVSDLTSERDGLRQQLEGVITAEVHNAILLQRDQLQTRVTELEATAQTAGQQAAEIVAGVAVPPVSTDEPAGSGTGARTVAEMRAEFDAESDPAKRKALWAYLSAAMK